MKKLACLGVAIALLMATGCASRYVSMKTVGPETYAVGDVAVLSQKVSTVRIPHVDGTVTVEVTDESIQSVKTEEAAELEYKLAELEAKVAIAQAKYSQVKVINPCGGWNPPVNCRDQSYGYGSLQYRGGRQGSLPRRSRGQGSPPTVIYTGEATITTGGK